jgi:SAM-dependent methyltransferase
MMNKKLLRWLGVYFLLDGLSTLLFGRKYVRIFYFGPKNSPYRRMIRWLLDLPTWQLRSAGAAEAGLGLAVLNEAPLSVSSFYQVVAAGYAAIDPGWREWFYPQAHEAFDRALANSLPQGGDVLDLGSGLGINLYRIRALNLPYGSYTGVDISDAMLQRAIQRYGNLPNVHFHQLDLVTDPLPGGSYDLILSTWMLEHLPDPLAVVKKAWEKLEPGGRMELLIETQGRSFSDLVTGFLYNFIRAHRIETNEYQWFPGQLVSEDHFSGPFGELTLLVLEKPKAGKTES